jgi:preprotein translocase subunit SecG
MFTVLTILHVFVCLFLILVVLLQAGKGGGMGIGFGSATSQSVFGGSGAGNFLSRTTAVVATLFILNSLALAYLSTQRDSPRLKALAAEKQKAKESEEAAKTKILKDLEKARDSAAKGAPAATESAPATNAPANPGAAAPATETAAPPTPESPAAPAAKPPEPAPPPTP